MNKPIDIPEFNVSIKENKKSYFYRDNDDSEERNITIPKSEAEILSEKGNISISEAVCILGVVRRIYLEASTMDVKITAPKKRLLDALCKILPYVDVESLYAKLSRMKYMDIENICNAGTPLLVYNEI